MTTNEKDCKSKLPLEEAAEIQEALRPLGYSVHSFKDGRYSGNGLIIVELRAGGLFPYRESPHAPDQTSNVGMTL